MYCNLLNLYITMGYDAVCGLLNVSVASSCISGTDLPRELYVLPHWDRSCRSNLLSHLGIIYCHWANKSLYGPYNIQHWQGRHWSINFQDMGMTRQGKSPTWEAGFAPRSAAFTADTLPPGQHSSQQGTNQPDFPRRFDVSHDCGLPKLSSTGHLPTWLT